ncbi:hypothetical protein [Mesorhizobium sp. 1B3]|uniref:hypothetical protein n=1 Tax=Mesorhizobium sp. 1B3 TaxID=3243599 RepID=UPI003D96EBF0
MLIIWLGGALVIAGLLYLAGQAIWRGRMSEAPQARPAPSKGTLEPPQRGVRFLALGPNWPGLALMVAGALLLLVGAL